MANEKNLLLIFRLYDIVNTNKQLEQYNTNKEFRNTKSNQFTCPQQDGHFGDPVDCAKFYRFVYTG